MNTAQVPWKVYLSPPLPYRRHIGHTQDTAWFLIGPKSRSQGTKRSSGSSLCCVPVEFECVRMGLEVYGVYLLLETTGFVFSNDDGRRVDDVLTNEGKN